MSVANSSNIASAMIDWIPAAIVFALGMASFAVVFTAAIVAYVGLLGFREIKRSAVSAATDAADDGLRRHLESKAFKDMVRSEAKSVSFQQLLSDLSKQLSSDGKEGGNG